MKFILLLVAIAIAFSAAQDTEFVSHQVFGNFTPASRVFFRQFALNETGPPGTVYATNIEVVPLDDGRPAPIISVIVVSHSELGNGTVARVLSGGVGENHAVIELRTQPGGTVDARVSALTDEARP